MPGEVLLTADEVAARLHIHVQTIYLWARTHRIPSFKIGHSLRFRPDMIDAWIRDQENARGS